MLRALIPTYGVVSVVVFTSILLGWYVSCWLVGYTVFGMTYWGKRWCPLSYDGTVNKPFCAVLHMTGYPFVGGLTLGSMIFSVIVATLLTAGIIYTMHIVIQQITREIRRDSIQDDV